MAFNKTFEEYKGETDGSNGGEICPYCGEKTVIPNSPYDYPTCPDMVCTTCWKTWEEVWEMTGLKEYPKNSRLNTPEDTKGRQARYEEMKARFGHY